VQGHRGQSADEGLVVRRASGQAELGELDVLYADIGMTKQIRFVTSGGQ
jgi:hypothetical protein